MRPAPLPPCLFRAYGMNTALKPDAETSSLLFFGFATDTGFFRHLEGGTGPVFNRVAEMIDNGASPNAVYRRINAGRELGTRRLIGPSSGTCPPALR